jgi:hypothetical protein
LLGVAELNQVNISPELPDISGPWVQLRQLRDSRRLLQSATPVENVNPGETAAPEDDKGTGENTEPEENTESEG